MPHYLHEEVLYWFDSAEDALTYQPEAIAVIDSDAADWLRSKTPQPTYSAMRRTAYPSVGDQLGALIKGGEELIAMQAIVQAVKDKYPKG